MVVGLVLVSTAVAVGAAIAMLVTGGGSLAALGVYFTTGFVCTIMLLLRVQWIELNDSLGHTADSATLSGRNSSRPAKPV